MASLLQLVGVLPANAATSLGFEATAINVLPSSTTNINGAIANDFTVSGFSTDVGEKVRVTISMPSGSGKIKLSSIANLTAIDGYPLDLLDNTTIGFTATQADANTALNNLSFVATSTEQSASVKVDVSYTGSATYPYNAENQHFYRLSSTAVTFDAAKSEVAAGTGIVFNGMRGYLATSTSSSENAFIKDKSGGVDIWLGGSDSAAEGTWKWLGGPEFNNTFWTGTSSGTVTGYANWNSSEPNNSGVEDALQMLASDGKWNDLRSNVQTLKYLIEFGGMAETQTYAPTSKTLAINVAWQTVGTGLCVQKVESTSGVSVTYTGGKCVIQFTSGANKWIVPSAATTGYELVVIGAGGGGGGDAGGGGGGGGSYRVAAVTNTVNTIATTSIGSGGRPGIHPTGVPSPLGDGYAAGEAVAGGNTTFASNAVTYTGGGGGAGAYGTNSAGVIVNGGSGGTGSGTGGTAFTGGRGGNGSNFSGNGPGSNGSTGSLTTSTSGTSTTYAGGGGGGASNTSGTLLSGGAGANGGGNGAGGTFDTSICATAGAANTGGGGGAGRANDTVNEKAGCGAPYARVRNGQVGGSGLIIISYADGLDAPSNVFAVTDSDTQITLNWTAPTPAGAALTDYKIFTSTNGGSTFDAGVLTGSTAVSKVITGLTANTLYAFKVQALATAIVSLDSNTAYPNTYPVCVTAESSVVINGVGRTVVQFKSTPGGYCRWTAPNVLATNSADYLVVGGGASGTRGVCNIYWGQGGGGGSVVSGTSNFRGTQTIAVGAGGATSTATCSTPHTGNAGGLSKLATVTANGGAGGVSETTADNGRKGGVSGNSNLGGVTGSINTESNPVCSAPNYCGAGGGGGAGAAGSGVNGGTGISSSITGTAFIYGSGGAGRSGQGIGTSTGGAGSAANGGVATANSGGGGSDTVASGGAGGSGLVVISYVGGPTITSVSPASGSTQGGSITINGTNFTAGSTAKIDDTPLQGVVVVSSSQITASVPALTAAVYAVSVTTTAGTATLANAYTTRGSVDVAFTQVIFSYSGAGFGHANITTRVGAGDCASSDADCIGKVQGDQVLFYNVTTRDGVAVDALVTTETVNAGASIRRYEVGASAGGTDEYFQTDIRITTVNALVKFRVDFYLHGSFNVAAPDSNRVTLENVNVSGIDIDYGQFNSFYKAESYTRSSDTRLTVTTIRSGSPDSDFKFQGSNSIGSNVPQDQIVLNYGSFNSMSFDVGSTKADSSNNALFGVTFIALGWGSTTPVTVGGTDYTLAYSGNGNTSGSVPTSQTGKVGQNMTVSANSGTLVRTGYVFNGWNTKADGTGTNYAVGSKLSMPKGGTTVYAKWTGNSYTLAYNANGGTSAPASVTANNGQNLNVSATQPTRSGFVFGGWYTTASGTDGTAYASSAPLTMPNSNLTLYAVWTQNNFSLVYSENTGSAASLPTQPAAQAVGSTVTLSATIPTKTGFTFSGWNTAANGTGTNYAASGTLTMPSGGVVVYAKWTANTNYTLTYSANGGTGAPASEVRFEGQVANLSATVPTRTGYTFGGWNVVAAGTGTNYASSVSYTMPNAATILYAKWTVQSFTITYAAGTAGGSASGVTVPGTSTVAYQASHTVGAPSATTVTTGGKTYTFTGWSNGSTIYKTGSSIVMGTSNIVLTAQWVEAFDVKYIPNGGTPGTAQGDSECTSEGLCTAAQEITLNPSTTFTRTGYTFSGWIDQAGANKAAGSSNTLTTTNFIFTASWTANNYSLIYNTNGGSAAPATQTVAMDATASISGTPPTRSGYNFVEWNTNINGTGTGTAYPASGSFVMPASNVTLFAIWSPVQSYLIVYNPNGGSNAPSDGSFAQASDATVAAAGSMTYPGFGFTGWNTAADGSGTARAAGATFTMPNSNVYLFAQWGANAITVTYDGNQGISTASPISGNSGSAQTITSTDPTRTGYTFTGWNTLANGNGTSYTSGSAYQMPNADASLFAQWLANVHIVSYNANGGVSAPDSSNQNFAATVTTVAVGSMNRTGYIFTGWNTTANGSGSNYVAGSGTFTMPDAAVTLFAQWAAASFKIIYNANNGSGGPGILGFLTDAAVTVSSTAPTRTGYTFTGWNEEADGTGIARAAGSAYTMPAQNVTFYAVWSANVYRVSYNSNTSTSGTAPVDQTGTINSTATVSAATGLLKTGFYFAGWSTAADGSGTSYAPGATYTYRTTPVILYARWVADAQTLSYNANGGINAPISETQTTGAAVNVSLPGAMTRTGYTFTGWTAAADGSGTVYTNGGGTFTMPGTATILYAKWALVNYTITYNLNTGTGDVPVRDPATATLDQVIDVADSNGISKANSTFTGWNTAANGSGTSYAVFSTFKMPAENVILYAQWSGLAYTLAYNANGGNNAPAPQGEISGTSVAVAPATPSRSGFNFVNWNVVPAGTSTSYNAGGTLTMPSDNLILFAVWQTQPAISFPNPEPPVWGARTLGNLTQGTAKVTLFELSNFTSCVLLNGAIPEGMLLNTTTCTITGTPTKVGPYSFTLLARNNEAQVARYFEGVVAAPSPKEKPVITWATPTPIIEGSALTVVQLNAKSSVPGKCIYTPALATVMAAGTYKLTCRFVPDDLTKYQEVEVQVELIVYGKSAPQPTPIVTYSDKAKSGDILNVSGAVKITVTTVGRGLRSATVSGAGVLVTPILTFSGKTTVTTTVIDNGQSSVVIVPVTVLPLVPVTRTYGATSLTSSKFMWNKSPNAISYDVFVDDIRVCKAVTTLTCNAKLLTGPKSRVQIIANGNDVTVSEITPMTYKAGSTPIVMVIVNFDSAKFVIKSRDKVRLQAFALLAKKYGFTHVRIFGHTDSDGGINNKVLSNNRSKATLNYLKALLPGVTFTLGGSADKKPAATNSTAAGKATNRRAEVTVY